MVLERDHDGVEELLACVGDVVVCMEFSSMVMRGVEKGGRVVGVWFWVIGFWGVGAVVVSGGGRVQGSDLGVLGRDDCACWVGNWEMGVASSIGEASMNW